jgi:hypothetical protein
VYIKNFLQVDSKFSKETIFNEVARLGARFTNVKTLHGWHFYHESMKNYARRENCGAL